MACRSTAHVTGHTHTQAPPHAAAATKPRRRPAADHRPAGGSVGGGALVHLVHVERADVLVASRDHAAGAYLPGSVCA